MTELESNQAILQSLLERDVENIYANLKNTAFNMLPTQFRPILNNYIRANEVKWISKAQEYVDMLVLTSFVTPETTIEEAVANAQETLNSVVGGFLQEKLGIDLGTVNIALNILLGTGI